jgi:hypothetical protein
LLIGFVHEKSYSQIQGAKSEAAEFFGFKGVNKVSVLIIFLILLGLFLLFIWWMINL